MKRSIILFPILLASVLITQPVLAHTGAGFTVGFASGFSHPLSGLDHLLAMIAVGILAAQLGGRAIWMVPAAFVGMMLTGAALGIAGVGVPIVEQGIVGSVIVLGLVLAIGHRLPVTLAASLAGVLAVLHGHAHGTEMAITVGASAYVAGFAAATMLLHAVGVSIRVGAQQASEKLAPAAVRIAGVAIAATGLALVGTP